MTIPFTMVGKIAPIKTTDKFIPYDERVTDSGWKMRKLSFNGLDAGSKHFLRISGMCKADESNKIYTYKRRENYNSKEKAEELQIPFKERLSKKWVDQVDPYRLFVIDLEKPGRRSQLKSAVETIKKGETVTEETLKELGLESADKVNAAYEASLKKRKEYISAYDFAEMVNKLLSSDKYKNAKFKIKGTRDIQYKADFNGVWDNLEVQKIYLAADDEKECANELVRCYFNSDSIVEGEKEFIINGRTFAYDRRFKDMPCKGNIATPYSFVIKKPEAVSDETEKRKNKKLISIFTEQIEENVWYETNIICEMINGSESSMITFDDLDDDLKEDVELGLISERDAIEAMGGTIQGEIIKESVLKGFGKRSAKVHVEATDYEDEAFALPIEEEKNEPEDMNASDDDDLVFDDIDDIV